MENFHIKELKNIPRFFVDPRLSSSNPLHGGHYRPFVTTSYAINYAVGGLNPVGYHLVNLAFHVGTAFVIYLIVKAMLGGRLEVRSQKLEVRSKKQEARQEAGNGDVECFAALTAGLIFLVHPFNSEAVNYTTARSSVMSGFFYLLGFW
ncbi:MAG: hypothetical protein HZA18_05875, partial [Nitrospirae bacterium]|nr:hypothetical protein [Nitrospirota bacterium]